MLDELVDGKSLTKLVDEECLMRKCLMRSGRVNKVSMVSNVDERTEMRNADAVSMEQT